MLKMIDCKRLVVGLTFLAVVLSAGAVNAQPVFQAPPIKTQRIGAGIGQPIGNPPITTINGKPFPAYQTVGLNQNFYTGRVSTVTGHVDTQTPQVGNNLYSPPANNQTFSLSTPNFPTPYNPNAVNNMVLIYPTYPGSVFYINNPNGFVPYYSNPSWPVNNPLIGPLTNPFSVNNPLLNPMMLNTFPGGGGGMQGPANPLMNPFNNPMKNQPPGPLAYDQGIGGMGGIGGLKGMGSTLLPLGF